MRRNNTAGGSKATTNTNATTASVTTQENNSFMSNVMLSSPLNDDGSNSLTSTPSITMETDHSPDLKFSRSSSYDLSKDTQQRRDCKYLVLFYRWTPDSDVYLFIWFLFHIQHQP